MTVHLHRAERTDRLADGLAAMLSRPLADPFAEEVVVVPERGIERWLAQRLSHRLGSGPGGQDGVCAGVRFLRPSSLVTQLVGREADDPWLPRQLVWPLLQVIDDSLDEPWCASLARHLGHGLAEDEARLRAGRRYSVALRLATHLHRYALARPAMLTDWRDGQDTDGAGHPLPDDLQWQAELWRRLVDVVPGPTPDQRHVSTVADLREGRLGDLDLPARLSLFGHTRLAVTEVELLAALGTQREVYLWLPQPSPALWDDLRDLGGVLPRRDDDSGRRVSHPLLASLGRDSRELVRVLAETSADDLVDDGDLGPPEHRPRTVLGWLQEDIRAGRAPAPDLLAERRPDPDDRSLALHAAHGPHRQVEVLREVLVGLLQDDPTLQPRDILVMCPDVETYAPLIGAAFGLGDLGQDDDGIDTHPAHRLRVRLADRSLEGTNPLLEVAARIIDLVDGRLTAGDVLDLVSTAPVRRRFRIDDEDLETITDWLGETAVRWGWDAAHRTPFGLGTVDANTWRAGLDRLLLGTAVSADGPPHVAAVLPVDDVGSGSVDLVGRLSELMDRLVTGLDALGSSGTAQEWMTTLGRTVRGLTETDPTEVWQVAGLDRVLAEAAEHAPSDVPLRVADVRVLLDDRLEGRPTRASFRTGTLTVCTMVPMRSVPHRVICLLGLDDGAYPRQPTVDGDDVLARDPMTGERDARSEDRQLLLDAVMAATERLVVLWTGADERTGERRPPAVPVGELLDAARETTTDPTLPRVIAHPLQPFDERNLRPGGLDLVESFSFDRAALAGARAAQDLDDPPAMVPAALAPPGDLRTEVSLADLVSFLENPARGFLRDRLGIALPREADELGERIPLDLDALERWQVGDRVLRARRAGATGEDAYRAELLRGELPPGELGTTALREVQQVVEGVVRDLDRFTGGSPAASVDVTVDLLDGLRLTGTVDGVHAGNIVDATYSRVGARHEIGAWARLLALVAASGRDEAHQAAVLGKGRGAILGPLPAEAARAHLSTLAQVRAVGQQIPVLVPVKTGRAWAEAAGDGRRTRAARNAAGGEWAGRFPESEDRWWTRLLGAAAPLERLTQTGPGDLDGSLPTQAPAIWRPVLANRRTP